MSSLRGNRARTGLLVPAALTTVYLVWGSTYLAIRGLVETIPPLMGAGARFLLAGGIVYAFLWLRGGARRVRVRPRELLGAGLIGTLLLLGGNGLVTVAEQEAPSGLTALIIAAVPLWVILLRLVSHERVPAATLWSVAIGFVGVALLVVPGDRPDGAALWSVLLLLVASLSWAIGSFISGSLSLPDDVFVATALEMLLGGAALLAVGVVFGEASELDLASYSGRSIAAFLYLVLAGSLLAFTAYVWLLKSAPISTVATYAFVNPVVAVILGWVVLAEELTAFMLAGATVIVCSVAFVVRRESGKGVTGTEKVAEAGSKPAGRAADEPAL